MTTTDLSEFVHHIERHSITEVGKEGDQFIISHLCHPRGQHPPNLWGEEHCPHPEPCTPDCPYCQRCNPVAFAHGSG